MQKNFLHTLHCPYSGGPLSLSNVAKENTEEIEYGVVSSEAGDFPIVAGILRLLVDEYQQPIVDYLRQNRLAQALVIAMDESPFGGRRDALVNFATRVAFRTGFTSAAERLNRFKRNYARLFTDNRVSFTDIAQKFKPNGSANWQLYRFSAPTFLPVFPLTHLVKQDGAVLDFGCGTGQASFLISRLSPASEILCADYSFGSLYLAKKYFAPDADYVCLNGNYPLPFDSGQFSTVFSCDALHCIDSKLSLAQEFKRVASTDAVTILPHLHNRLISPYAKSFTPKGYRALFKGMDVCVLSEEETIRGYFFDDAVDLRRDSADDELAASKQGLSIVASTDSSVFQRREHLWSRRIRSFHNPRINPAYRITGEPGNWTLIRSASEKYANALISSSKVCLPDSRIVRARSVDAAGLVELQRADPKHFAELARSLLLLDTPERFMAEEAEGSAYKSSPVPARAAL